MASENQMETFESVLKVLKDLNFEIKSIEFDTESDKVTIYMIDRQEQQLVR
jgi:ribosome maturation factor RimP